MKTKLTNVIKRFTWLDWLILVLLIIFLVYFLILGSRLIFKKSPTVDYVTSNETVEKKEIWVDISGAVVSPGVYKVVDGSRVKDVLVSAGGYSSAADREFISKQINLAAKVADGEKIFIPMTASMSGGAAGTVQGASTTTGKINVNTASVSELDSLIGIGAVRASQIVSNRPYSKLDDLVTKKVITKSILDKIRDQIVVY